MGAEAEFASRRKRMGAQAKRLTRHISSFGSPTAMRG